MVERWSEGSSPVDPNNHHDSQSHDIHGYLLQEESPVIYHYLELYSMVHPVAISSAFTHTSQIMLDLSVIDYLSSTSTAPWCQRHDQLRVIALYSRLYVLESRLATIQPTCGQRMTLRGRVETELR